MMSFAIFAIFLNAFAFAANVGEIKASIDDGFLLIHNDEEVDYEEDGLVFTGAGRDKYNYTHFKNGKVVPRDAVDQFAKDIQVDIGEDAKFGLMVYHKNDEVIFVTRLKTSHFKKKINVACFQGKWKVSYDDKVEYKNKILVGKNMTVGYQITEVKEFETLPSERLSEVIELVKNQAEFDVVVYVGKGIKHLVTHDKDVALLYPKKQPEEKDLGDQEYAQQ